MEIEYSERKNKEKNRPRRRFWFSLIQQRLVLLGKLGMKIHKFQLASPMSMCENFFNQHINQNNFSEFKHSSRCVLDSLLTIFFAKIFGIKNINSYIDSNETEWIKNYFQSLKIPNLTEQ